MSTTDTRQAGHAVHLVLGNPVRPPWPDGHELAMVGMGCFWGAERIFWQLDGIWTTFAAYAGGEAPEPSYHQVCAGTTGHAETVGIVHDPAVIGYEELLAVFWEHHDPTQGLRQGNDIGPQYRSVVLVTSDEQRAVAEVSRDRYQRALDGVGAGAITTEIVDLDAYWLAEDYHQQYLAKNPNGYCNIGFCQVAYSG